MFVNIINKTFTSGPLFIFKKKTAVTRFLFKILVRVHFLDRSNLLLFIGRIIQTLKYTSFSYRKA